VILEEIRLTDFRCFYGECSIKFSEDPEKNVTIIYAENGVGKTTLLNALLWCFYGETTAKFEKKDEILNYDAKQQGRRTASVEVLFEHNESRYIAKRFSGAPGREFIVSRIDEGSQTALPTPDTFINTVIPRQMASHFLFDGEYAEVFVGEVNQDSIRKAVRDILGCSLIEMAIDDLQAVSNGFRKKIQASAASGTIVEKSNRLDALINQTNSAEQVIKELKSDLAQTEQQIKDIDDKLRNTSAAKELQRSRERLQSQLSRSQSRQKEYKDEVYKWLGDNGRFIVSKKITEETFEFLDEKEHRGRIPSPYNEEFVKDVLEAKECICGAPLEPGSPESNNVARLLEKAANQIMRERITKVRARLSSLKNERAKAPGRLNTAETRLAEANDDFSTTEAQLTEIHEKIKGINFEDIAEREQRREELRKVISGIDQQIGALENRIKGVEREKRELGIEIDKLAQQDKKASLYGRRRTMCETIKGNLENQLTEEEDQARGVLRAGIRKVLEATSRKTLKLKMTDDYAISLVNENGIELPKSSGENQLLGLAFTAALVEFAKNRKNAQSSRLLPGTIAPLVLDSPYADLDTAYRATTSNFIPKMASQVVLLVSKAQGTDDVLNALEDHVGCEYLLVRHNKDLRGDREQESRHFMGKEFKTSVFDSTYDGTEIVRLQAHE